MACGKQGYCHRVSDGIACQAICVPVESCLGACLRLVLCVSCSTHKGTTFQLPIDSLLVHFLTLPVYFVCMQPSAAGSVASAEGAPQTLCFLCHQRTSRGQWCASMRSLPAQPHSTRCVWAWPSLHRKFNDCKGFQIFLLLRGL